MKKDKLIMLDLKITDSILELPTPIDVVKNRGEFDHWGVYPLEKAALEITISSRLFFYGNFISYLKEDKTLDLEKLALDIFKGEIPIKVWENRFEWIDDDGTN